MYLVGYTFAQVTSIEVPLRPKRGQSPPSRSHFVTAPPPQQRLLRMPRRRVAATPAPCRPPTSLLVEGQGGGPAPMELLPQAPHAAKRSRPQRVGAWRAWRPLLAAPPALSTAAQWIAPTSHFGAWLHGTAALDLSSIAWFQGPLARPPLHLMHLASGLGVIVAHSTAASAGECESMWYRLSMSRCLPCSVYVLWAECRSSGKKYEGLSEMSLLTPKLST